MRRKLSSLWVSLLSHSLSALLDFRTLENVLVTVLCGACSSWQTHQPLRMCMAPAFYGQHIPYMVFSILAFYCLSLYILPYCMCVCVCVYVLYVPFLGLAGTLSHIRSVLFDMYANGLSGQHSLPCSDTQNWVSLPHYGSTYSYW